MANDKSTTTSAGTGSDAKSPESVVHNFELTLEEFCTRLSTKTKKVELIASFFHVEKLAKKIKDTEENFMARFKAHESKPV